MVAHVTIKMPLIDRSTGLVPPEHHRHDIQYVYVRVSLINCNDIVLSTKHLDYFAARLVILVLLSLNFYLEKEIMSVINSNTTTAWHL